MTFAASNTYRALTKAGWTFEHVPQEKHVCRICHQVVEPGTWAWISTGYFFYHVPCILKSGRVEAIVKKFNEKKGR